MFIFSGTGIDELNDFISNPVISFEKLTMFSLLYGYFFVTVAFLLYKYLKHKVKFRDDFKESF